MRLNVKKYDYVWFGGKLHQIEIKQSKFKYHFKSIIIFLFKLINYKHITAKNCYNRPIIKEILEIKGIRSCKYVSYDGQIIICQFVRK